MEIDVSYWRKPRLASILETDSNADKFMKCWKAFDWTVMLQTE